MSIIKYLSLEIDTNDKINNFQLWERSCLQHRNNFESHAIEVTIVWTLEGEQKFS